MITTDIVLHVIRLGTAIEDYWDGGVRDVFPTYPLVGPDGKEPPRPPEEDELRRYLRTLPEADVYYLLAAVKIGWENVPVTDFGAYLNSFKQKFALPDAIEELVKTTYLTADLCDGLTILRPDGVDLTALPVAPVSG